MPNGTPRAATDRLPTGLTYSAMVAAISLAALTLLGGLGAPGGRGPQPLVHTAAGLCAVWSFLAYYVARGRPGLRSREDLVSVLQIASIVTGVLAAIVVIYAAMIEVLIRTRYFEYDLPWRVAIWPTGILDVGLLALSVGLHWARTRHENLVTVVFWLAILGSLWLSFSRPAARIIGAPGVGYQVPGDWASWFSLAGAATVAVFTIVQGVLADRRRRSAWPAALSDLTIPLKPWPGFDLSAGVIAAVVLVVGCAHVVLPWTIMSGFVAGAAVLILASRRWNENLADAGLALITLAVVSLCMLGFEGPVWLNYPSILTRAIFGLAVMVAVWHWLARVWMQQLDDGRAWTTAGRLIRTARRVGFLLACAAVLLALQLMLWPMYPDVLEPDNAPARWVAGLGASGVLLLALLGALRGTRRSTLGWLALLTIGSMGGFALVRAPNSAAGEWIALHWPAAMAGGAGLSLIAAWAVSRVPAWKALQEALVYTGVLLAPMGAISGVTLTDVLGHMPMWIPAGTFGLLAGVYVIAALHPGPSTFLSVSALCAVMMLWHFRDGSGRSFLPEDYFYGLMSGLCLALIAIVYEKRGKVRSLGIVKWMGVSLAVLSVAAGLLLGK